MSSKLLLALAVLILLSPFGTVGLFILYDAHLMNNQNSVLIGTVIGSLLSVAASTFIWFLTHWQKVRESERSKRAFCKALWTDLGGLQDTAFREAQWWQNEYKDPRFGATENRLIVHIQAGVLEANLNRITDVPTRAADALLTLRAGFLILHDLFKAFYPNEDKLIDHEKEKKIMLDAATAQMKVNKGLMFQALFRVAALARQACLSLDESGEFEKERRASFTAEEWVKREKDENQMNMTLDTFRAQRNIDGSRTI